ncbi:MAG: DNA-directed RNA polymerase subunit alpha [Parcubacteria group bacterium]
MIPLPSQPKIVKKEGAKAIFEIESLYPGYGVTVGNSLRRVLLSSLQGAAITQMKVRGVSHEFSTIPGVQEDVITLMLNLKKLRFRVFSEEPQTGKLHIKGEKEAKGSDFELPSQVELVNKDCRIATLTAKSSDLEIEITIEKGVGYFAREDRKKEKLGIGVIPLDAIFTPLKKVSFKVENMRVGERTDFDKLSLEIETDGTISPETAFSQAAKILVLHFSMFSETFAEEIPVPGSDKEATAKITKKKRASAVKKQKHEKKKKGKKT